MPSIKKVASKVQLEVERLDGGYNSKFAPSKISLYESPDCLNVVFDDEGAVSTRDGTAYLNSSTINSNPIDGMASYNGSLVAWCGGSMYSFAASAPTLVTASSGQFASGTQVVSETYQGILFCSDGSNAYRYESPTDFYDHGINTPSAPTGTKNTTTGYIVADDYFYRVAFQNSAVVNGEAGSVSATVTLGASGVVSLTDIPVAGGLQGVSKRIIYRSTSATGTFGKVGEISDNTTTTFTDNTPAGSEGVEPESDATAPAPYTTIKLHQERLWFDDSSDRTLLRYTEYTNPYVSKALSFIPLNQGDGSNILGIAQQDNLVTVGKSNSIWIVVLNDPSDDTTFTTIRSPANLGFAGSRSYTESQGALVFVGQQFGRVTGFHILSGITVVETADEKVRTESISEKVEKDVLAWPMSLIDNVALATFKNRIYAAVPLSSSSTALDGIYWFDTTRIGSEGQPGSWAPWDGIAVQNFVVHEGVLYGGSNAQGSVIKFNSGAFSDADGSAIDSYYWTGEVGGEPAIESYIKDFRKINVWYAYVDNGSGSGKIMNVKYRTDPSSDGDTLTISLNPGGSLWGTFVWDVDNWGGGKERNETQLSLGTMLGRRGQFRFDNNNAVDQAFKVYSYKLLMNLRRQLG